MSSRPLGRSAAALLAVAVAVAGCGETVIDNQKLEEPLQSNLEKALHEKIKSVSCPSEHKGRTGQDVQLVR